MAEPGQVQAATAAGEGGGVASAAYDNDEDAYSYEYSEDGSDGGEGSSESEEPPLKYQRLGASVSEVLSRDAASTLCVHPKFLALGTHWGVVHLLDVAGNKVASYPCHTATVNEISIDGKGEYMASCSDDGKVVINGLYSNEVLEFSYHRPVRAVALDPLFNEKDNRRFCTGGLAEQLIINKKGWFSSKDTVLHAKEGPIHAIKWQGSVIAWANNLGVKMYDFDSRQRITYIDRPEGSPRPDLYRCHLCWRDDRTLLIGWADCVKVCVVRDLPEHERQAGMPTRYVEITSLFQTSYYISGICPFGEHLAILAYVEDEDPEGGAAGTGASRPELRITTMGNEEISSNALSVHGYEHYHANDYRLAWMRDDPVFYIVSPKDIVVAKERNLDDHVTWLLAHEKYEEALIVAEERQHELRVHKLDVIGERMLDHLLLEGKIDMAAAICPKVLRRDADRWETWVYRFGEEGHLVAIVPFIPTSNPQLSEALYEIVLKYFVDHDPAGLLATVKLWPPHIYVIANVIAAVEEKAEAIKGTEDGLLLMDVLAELYTRDGRFDRALGLHLELRRGDVFGLIEEHNLFAAVADKIVLLMAYSDDRAPALAMLVSHTEELAVAAVVAQLEAAGERRYLHEYLDALFQTDAALGRSYHEKQIPLYAEFDRPALLPFLRQSDYIRLERAHQLCVDLNLFNEQVFILGRMGDNVAALELIVDELGDVAAAIEFAREQDDEDLWELLISKAIRNPAFVSSLLEGAGGHVDPIKLIRRIPEGMEIPALRDKLVKIITDYNLQTALRVGCNRILKEDCVNLSQRLFDLQRKPVAVVDRHRCSTCDRPILSGARDRQSMVAFFCGHVYHRACLVTAAAAGASADAGQTSEAATGASGDAEAFPHPGTPGAANTMFCPICRSNERKKKKKETGKRGRGRDRRRR